MHKRDTVSVRGENLNERKCLEDKYKPLISSFISKWSETLFTEIFIGYLKTPASKQLEAYSGEWGITLSSTWTIYPGGRETQAIALC